MTEQETYGYLADDPTDELAIEAELTELAEAEWLLVALDFDGTLAPIVDHPEDARMLPEARRAIDALLNAPDVTVALISGRAIESLKQVADPDPRIILVGSHGAEHGELTAASTQITHGIDSDTLTGEDDLAELARSLTAQLGEIPGILFEPKPHGIAVHFRNVAPEQQTTVNAILAENVLLFPSLMTRTGKMVLEFSQSHSTKGDPLRILSGRNPDTAIFFAGDDLTDEDVFRILPELSHTQLGVKLGPGATHAKHRLKTLDQLPPLLFRLAELRSLRPQTGMSNPEASI